MRHSRSTIENAIDLMKTKTVKEVNAITGISIANLNKIAVSNNIERVQEDRRNYLNKMSREDLQATLNNSSSISNAIVNLGFNARQYLIDIIRYRIETEELDISNMKTRLSNKLGSKGKTNKLDMFVEKSKIKRAIVKKYIIANKIIEYKCSKCPIVDMYNGAPIVLQLDHINGINDDNRIDNLRFLCPNCHSQEPTSFGKKNKKDNSPSVCECGNVKLKSSIQCISCSNKNTNRSRHLRKFEVSKEELESLIGEKPMTEIGKMFGVSDNAVKKRCKKLGIEMKSMRGHWTKFK